MVGIRIYDELSFWQEAEQSFCLLVRFGSKAEMLFNQKDTDRHNDDVLVAMHDS